MATVALEQFLPEVLVEVEGVPSITATGALRNACFDFCRKSLAITELLPPVAYTQGTQTYSLTSPVWAQIVAVLNITVDSKTTIYPWAMDDVVANRPSWTSDVGVVRGFVQPELAVVSLLAIPDSSGVFQPQVAYAPTRTTEEVDARLFNIYLETIRYGALWKLKAMASRPWSDPQGAVYYEGRFWMGVNAAVIERNKSNSRAALRVSPVPFI